MNMRDLAIRRPEYRRLYLNAKDNIHALLIPEGALIDNKGELSPLFNEVFPGAICFIKPNLYSDSGPVFEGGEVEWVVQRNAYSVARFNNTRRVLNTPGFRSWWNTETFCVVSTATEDVEYFNGLGNVSLYEVTNSILNTLDRWHILYAAFEDGGELLFYKKAENVPMSLITCVQKHVE